MAAQSAKPNSSYQAFLTKLNDPQAASLLRAMKLFVRNALAATESANRSLSIDELAEAVQAFFQQTEADIAGHPLWAGCDAAELQRACDSVEKFVMTKLHDRVFAAEPVEAQEDEAVHRWMQRLRFLTVDHFAISPEFQALAPWTFAQQELVKIATYRTPRDKLVCILNCCKRINSALSHSSTGTHGADEFFPVLLYVTLQASPLGLHASLQYIVRFRHSSGLVSEAAYYLTHMQSALSFLSNVQPEQLSIDSASYEQGLAETHAALERERAVREAEEARAAEVAAAAAAATVAEAEAAAAATAAAAAAAAEAAAIAAAPTSVDAAGHVNGFVNGFGSTPPRKARTNSGVNRGVTSSALVSETAPETPLLLGSPLFGGRPLSAEDDSALPSAATPAAARKRPVNGNGMGVCVELRLVPAPGSDDAALRPNDAVGTGGGTPYVRLELELCSWLTVRRRQLVRQLGTAPSLRWLETRNIAELTIGDVRTVLEEYRWLSAVFSRGAAHERAAAAKCAAETTTSRAKSSIERAGGSGAGSTSISN